MVSICNARKYWEHVSFVGKYDKENKRIIILDQNQGILEFHNILQNSMDLSSDAAPIEVEQDFHYYRELTRRESKLGIKAIPNTENESSVFC